MLKSAWQGPIGLHLAYALSAGEMAALTLAPFVTAPVLFGSHVHYKLLHSKGGNAESGSGLFVHGSK